MDPPSNYPDFDALAAQVGGTVHPRETPDEAIDRYLGRLTAEGVTVHEQVRAILSSPTSLPNAVHHALVGLFKNAQQLRIVTTNFDRHFTTAAMDRFADVVPEEFYAPALPIGSEFTGIVYLHGSVDRPAHRMVLTDSDFGRAYITEAWATRFLERLFSRFVVLFVGYSHQDMLLSYLARGLTAGSPGPSRFALTLPGDDTRWKNLGITPVHYPVADAPKSRHDELRVALTAWAEQSEAGALAIEERIRTILTSSLALTPEDDDFLSSAIAQIDTLRFFTRHARDLKWLKWIESHKEFQRVLAAQSGYTQADAELATWFADHYALTQIEEALDIVRRQESRLSPILAGTISMTLFRNKIHGEVLSKWIPLLLDSGVPPGHNRVLEYVLSNCAYPEDSVAALLLFEYLTCPRPKLKESLRWHSEENEPSTATGIEVECVGSDYWLQHSWNRLFLPNLGKMAKGLQPLITAHLSAARRLLMSFRKADADWDPLSSSRGMIESRLQDHLHNGFSTLVDAGAAVVRWACEHDREWASALITEWFACESPLLRRLAVFGISTSARNADDKLRWVTDNELLYRFGFKHEVFLLLRAAYPDASEAARQELLRQATLQHKPFTDDRETADYELFNLIGWLADSDPNCKSAAAAFATLKEKNPGFARREHPDMDSWIGSVSYGGRESPITTAELGSLSIQQLVDWLDAAPNTGYPDGSSRQARLHAITQKAQTSHEWGFNIAREAQHHSIWLPDVWQPLISGWATTHLAENEWSDVLGILAASEEIYEHSASSIASLLERGVRSATAPIPADFIDEAKSLADAIWSCCENAAPAPLGDQVDWLARAINHPAGELIEFYLQAMVILQRAKLLTEARRGEYEQAFTRAINGPSGAAQLARIVVASQAHFLFAVSEQWTRNHLFPLLDPGQDEQRARQCWHGYLYWGRWTDGMLVNLMPSYEAMFGLIEREKDELRRMFCGHLAGIAVYASIHPLEQGWLSRFIAVVKADMRTVWAGELGRTIDQLDDSAKVHLWQRWLKVYWQERLQGRPVPLAPKETAQMLEWVLHLSPVVPEVVDLVCASPYPDVGNHMAYFQISQSSQLRQHPEAFANLLIFLTSGERDRPIYDLDQLYSAAEQLVELIPQNQQLRVLCDELARLGIAGVSALAARLQPPYTSTREL